MILSRRCREPFSIRLLFVLACASALPCRAGIARAAGPASSRATLATPSRAKPVDDFDLSAHQTLSRVNLLIRENYVDPERVKPYEMFLAALDYIQRTVPEIMVDDSKAPARITVSVGGKAQTFDLGTIDQLWEVTMALRDVFRFLQGHIHDQEEQRNIEWAAINGMLSTLDPHSVLLKAESFDEMKMSTRGEFGGLGIVISLRDGALTIIAPIEGTPAGNAGLQAKDKIVKIGIESTVNMGLDEAVQRLRGEPNSKVEISVLRKGWLEPRAFTLVRAIIKIESVSAKLLEGGIGYVKIKSFQGNTFDDLSAALNQLKQENKKADLKGLVLDLRNNPGGLLDQAILVSDRFIERGPLVITVGEGARRREVRNARFGPDEMTYPMVVLLNGGSASASEIVAGGLKNHDRAVVLGQQSFGKGSVQVLYDLDKLGLKLTIAQYLTPGDFSIQSVGVVPDILVAPATLEPDAIHLFVDDEALREKDLAKHLEQHGVTKLIESSEKLYHLLDAEPRAAQPGQPAEAAREAELDASVAQVTGAFHYDFEVGLAHDLLRRTHSLSRPQMLIEGAQLLKERGAEQEARIASRMGELGVDWRPGTNPNELHATLQLTVDKQAGAVRAGETLRLTAVLENTGKEPLYRMWAATQSDNPLFKHIEFPFGFVAPEAKVSWHVDLKLPKDLTARADEIVLPLAGQSGSGAPAGSVIVAIAEQDKPEFAYRASIVDDDGNGDGCLQAGEHVKLRVEVTNVGPGVAEETTVIAKNLSGQSLFLDTGRASIGRLESGQKKTVELSFLVFGQAAAKQAEQNARSEGDDRSFSAARASDVLSLRLMVWDSVLGASLSDKLSFEVAPPIALERKAVSFVHRRGRGMVYAGACAGAPVVGTLSADAAVTGDAMVGPFVRIQAATGERGFIARAELEPVAPKRASKRPTERPPRTEVAMLAPLQGPNIQLEKSSLLIDEEIFHLRGSVDDARGLKDMFIFVGDKKVYFRFLQQIPAQAGKFTHHFDVPIHLKPGTSPIGLFVRESEEVVGRKALFVHRRDPKGTVGSTVSQP